MQEVRGSTPLFSTFGRRAFAGRLFYFTILRISSEKILQASHLQQNALMQTNINNQPAFAVVIGASAGGLNALTELVGQLNNDMDIAVFIVLHLSNTAIGDYLVQRLQSYTSLTCKKAVNDEEIQKGFIYIAQPNRHLLVKKDSIVIGQGAFENRWRPSIDVLFRSAAVAFNTRAIGIILTGFLDDGTAGMLAIKRCGGVCIAQDPNEAEYPDMPLSVLNNMEVHFVISLAEIGDVIAEIISNPVQQEFHVPDDIKAESEIAEKVAIGIDNVKELGEQSVYSCPDCGGGLWEITDEKLRRYRCFTGHSYTESDLLVKQAENMEATLWVALRMMEERRNLLKRVEEDAIRKGFIRISKDHRQKREDLQRHIDKLKEALFSMQTINLTTEQ